MTSAAFTIESNIPRPRGWGGKQKYPWDEMEIGDSFYVKGTTVSRLCQAALSHAKSRNNGKKFSCRSEKGGARVWRIA